MFTGRQLKKIADSISDDEIVCIGERNDKLGRYDREIIEVETRMIGFDNNNTYKAIISEPYESNGTMKFWRQ